MTTSEKVAYLKGLAEGFGISTETKEGKLLSVAIEILQEIAHDVEDLEANSWELGEAIDQVSDDLADLEDYVIALDEEIFDDYDDDDYEDEDDDEDCC